MRCGEQLLSYPIALSCLLAARWLGLQSGESQPSQTSECIATQAANLKVYIISIKFNFAISVTD